MLERFFKKRMVWAFTTYFAEGFPFTVIRPVSSVFFRDMKVSLENIGMTSLFGLPWILKFLWAPLLDQYSTKRRWMLYTQGFLALMMILSAALSSLSMGVPLIAALFFIGAFIAATHDTAIDGYYLEALDEAGQARYVGYRVMAYRIAMMAGTGVIVTLGTTIGWPVAFGTAAAIFSLLFFIHLRWLAEVESPRENFRSMFRSLARPRVLLISLLVSGVVVLFRLFFQSSTYLSLKTTYPLLGKFHFSHWVAIILCLLLVTLALAKNRIRQSLERRKDGRFAQTFLSFVDRDSMGVIFVFIMFLRAGEFMLTTMVSPMIVDLGMKVHYGWISAGVGLPASIAGALLGGMAISRIGLKKVAFPIILFQNSTNILYMLLAFYLAPALHPANGPQTFNVILVAVVHGVEQLSGGMGTAVLMAFLMSLCKKEFKASHYAIGSGLMAVSGLFAGVASGFTASSLGYGWTFGLSFVVAAPALMVAPFLPGRPPDAEIATPVS
ncbi:MFS transporter [Myxococcota bacterium]|nr:MFS transporter [Myxococcota bacterium]